MGASSEPEGKVAFAASESFSAKSTSYSMRGHALAFETVIFACRRGGVLRFGNVLFHENVPVMLCVFRMSRYRRRRYA